MNKVCTLLTACCLAAGAHAQTSPVITPLGGRASWVVSIDSAPPAAAAAPTPAGQMEPAVIKRMETTKYDGLVRDVILYLDGTRTERWFLNGYDLVQEPNGYISVMDVTSNDLAPRYGGYVDFPMLRWVGADAFVGQVDLGERRADYFRGPDGSEAWIDAATKRPVKMTRDGRAYSFSFAAEPPGPLDMPEAFRKRYDAYMAPAREAVLYQMKR